MLTYAIVLFAFAAAGGLLLASKVLSGRLASWTISILHALLGASGLILLGVEVIRGTESSRVTAGLALLIVAALGGFYLASYHIREKIAPKGIVIIHAGLAVLGFLTLLTVLFGI